MVATGKDQKKAARTERLSAALRENLKRRKAQVRGRARAGDPADPAPPEEADTEATPDFRRNRSSE
jgi:hypothetical protein